jgi:hypothetical protein
MLLITKKPASFEKGGFFASKVPSGLASLIRIGHALSHRSDQIAKAICFFFSPFAFKSKLLTLRPKKEIPRLKGGESDLIEVPSGFEPL